MEVLEKSIQHQDIGKVDWNEVWNRVEAVTSNEWVTLKQQLKQTYQRISALMHAIDDWDDDDRVGGAIAIIVHTAYHLGEIRQALCTL